MPVNNPNAPMSTVSAFEKGLATFKPKVKDPAAIAAKKGKVATKQAKASMASVKTTL